MQLADGAGAREIFVWLARLEGMRASALMADALRKLTTCRPWDSSADRDAVEAVLTLLRLVADEKARLEVEND